jgi:hypothetical protein
MNLELRIFSINIVSNVIKNRFALKNKKGLFRR